MEMKDKEGWMFGKNGEMGKEGRQGQGERNRETDGK